LDDKEKTMVRKGVWIAVILGIVAACGTGIRAHAAGDILAAGATAPNFSLPSQEDTSVSLSQYKGKWVVLYFYPNDTVESHKTFCTKDSLTFKLLADPDHKVIDAYGVPISGMGPVKFANRDTFLISPAGKIVKVWTGVNPNMHSDDVLAAIAGMNGDDKLRTEVK
jgi:peroxiredoxin Q/BCP